MAGEVDSISTKWTFATTSEFGTTVFTTTDYNVDDKWYPMNENNAPIYNTVSGNGIVLTKTSGSSLGGIMYGAYVKPQAPTNWTNENVLRFKFNANVTFGSTGAVFGLSMGQALRSTTPNQYFGSAAAVYLDASTNKLVIAVSSSGSWDWPVSSTKLYETSALGITNGIHTFDFQIFIGKSTAGGVYFSVILLVDGTVVAMNGLTYIDSIYGYLDRVISQGARPFILIGSGASLTVNGLALVKGA